MHWILILLDNCDTLILFPQLTCTCSIKTCTVFMIVALFVLRFAAPDGFHHIKPQPSMKDGISKVKSEIKGVMGIMQNNISKVLDRGTKLEDLQDKSGKI